MGEDVFDINSITELAGSTGTTGGLGLALGWLLFVVRRQRKALKKIAELAMDGNMKAEDRLSRIQLVLLWAKHDPTTPDQTT